MKEKLLEYLRSRPNRSEKSLWMGDRNLSINDLIREVENDTEDGKKWVELYAETEALQSRTQDRRRGSLLAGAVLVATLAGLIVLPDGPPKALFTCAMLVAAGLLYLLPRIPPGDLHIKP